MEKAFVACLEMAWREDSAGVQWPPTVLFLGCGDGEQAAGLVAANGAGMWRALLSDWSPSLLAEARGRCGTEPPWEYYMAQPWAVPETPKIAEGGVDLAWVDLVARPRDTEAATRALKGLNRLLSAGGLLFLRAAPWDVVGAVNDVARMGSLYDERRLRRWPWATLSATLVHLGYSILAARPEAGWLLCGHAPAMDWHEE